MLAERNWADVSRLVSWSAIPGARQGTWGSAGALAYLAIR